MSKIRTSVKSLQRTNAEETQEAKDKAQEELELTIADFNEKDQDFIKTIAAFSRNLEADSISVELQVKELQSLIVWNIESVL